ncbi:hypothetical protein EYF80_034057 [Liparis tanakae]|uniref:Uncharacterized protein n=1 Tax=Liparis tanakae TaxID=230148 RepID=A0A4Z2GSJ3_9TELE|nr:hypothetical protein EYF80_034057 [Liparis tanakae]
MQRPTCRDHAETHMQRPCRDHAETMQRPTCRDPHAETMQRTTCREHAENNMQRTTRLHEFPIRRTEGGRDFEHVAGANQSVSGPDPSYPEHRQQILIRGGER